MGPGLGSADQLQAKDFPGEFPSPTGLQLPPSKMAAEGEEDAAPKPSGKRTLSKIRDELTCSICSSLLEEPKTLPCLHSFCRGCLDGLVQKGPSDGGDPEGTRNEKLPCPLCRDKTVPPSEDGIKEKLPTNFALKNMADHLRLEDTVTGTGNSQGGSREVPNAREGASDQAGASPGVSSKVSAEPCAKQTVCTVCEDEVAVHFCTACSDSLCDQCMAQHVRIRKYKTHANLIVPLGSQPSEASSTEFTGIAPNAWICEKHKEEGEKVVVYCKDCKEVACTRCTIDLHKGHDFAYADSIHKTYRAEISQLTGDVQVIQRKFEEAIQQVQATKESLEETTRAASESIHQQYDKIVAKVKEDRDSLLQKVDDIKKRKVTCLVGQQEELQRIRTTIEQSTKFTQEFNDSSIPIEFMFLWSQLKLRMESLHTDYNGYAREPKDNDIVNFAKNEEFNETLEAPNGCNIVGEVFADPHLENFSTEGLEDVHFVVSLKSQFTVSCRDISGTRLRENHLEVKVEMKPEGEGANSNCSVENNHDGTYKVIITPLTRGRHVLQLSVLGQRIPFPKKWTPIHKEVAPLPCTKPDVVHIINRTETNKIKNPWGVAVSNDGKLVVSDIEHNCISVFNMQWQHLTSFGKKGNKKVEFKSPRGLAVTPQNTIVVVEKENHRVQEVTLDGDFVRFFGNSNGVAGNELGHFRKPTGVAVNKDGIVFVTDSVNQRIQYFKADGSHLGVIARWGYGSSPGTTSFNEPYAITVYNYQVADQSSRGEILKDREVLFITEHNGDGIRCFERQANGEYEPVEFPMTSDRVGGPRIHSVTMSIVGVGIAVDPRTGFIFVAEMSNQHISILSRRGEPIKTFGEKGEGPLQFHNPMSIAVLHDSKLVVTDCANSRVCILKVFPD